MRPFDSTSLREISLRVSGVVMLLIVAAACGGGSPPRAEPPPPAPASTCVADRVPQPLPAQEDPIVCEGAEKSCRDICEAGRAAACLSLAYLVEPDEGSQRDAFELYERACEGGLLLACTNAGAYLVNADGIDEDPVCATRLHQLACDGGEVWGCGMLGYALASGIGRDADLEQARELLETSCARLGSFACRVLGDLVEGGRLGDADPAAAFAAYARACETGDVEACPEAARLAPVP